MGSGQSTTKPAEMQEPDTGTQLFGSWDKPVAKAYALKKHASKKGNAVGSKAANAANAALGSAIELEAGAGVKPTGGQTPGKHKGAGPTRGGATKKGGQAWTLSQSSKDPAKVTAAKLALKGKLSKHVAKKPAQSAPKVLGNAGKKKSADAWTLSQSSKSPAKVAAARKGLEGKLSQSRKSSQGTSTKKAVAPKSTQQKPTGDRRSSMPGPHMPRGKTAVFSSAKLGLKKNSGVMKKSKAAAGTASKVAGKATEAAQEVATASKGAAAGAATAAQTAAQTAATAVQGAATAAKSAATQAVNSAQKAVKDSGVMDSTAVAEASHVASKVSAAVKEAAHTIQGAMSVAMMQPGAVGAVAASPEKGIRSNAAHTPEAAQKAKAAAAVAKSEVKKCAGKIASKAPKAKKALKRMVSEIDAEDAKTEGLGRGKRQRKQVKAFEPNM